MAKTYPFLEEIWLKRMVVCDESLELISSESWFYSLVKDLLLMDCCRCC